MSRYFLLDAEPDEIASAVDVDYIVERVCTLLHRLPEVTLAPLLVEQARVKIMPGSAIEDVALAMGTTTGFTGACHAAALFLPPRTILLPRLDWPGLFAHEACHLVQLLAGLPPDEHEAGWAADQW